MVASGKVGGSVLNMQLFDIAFGRIRVQEPHRFSLRNVPTGAHAQRCVLPLHHMGNMVGLARFIPFSFWFCLRMLMPRGLRVSLRLQSGGGWPGLPPAFAAATATDDQTLQGFEQGGAGCTLAPPKLGCHNAPPHRTFTSCLLQVELHGTWNDGARQHMMDIFFLVAARIAGTKV